MPISTTIPITPKIPHNAHRSHHLRFKRSCHRYGNASVNQYYDGSAYHRAAQPIESEYLIAVGACFDDDGLCDPFMDYDLGDDEFEGGVIGVCILG